ncbi:hypothetical protein CFC35_41695 [Streptomyces sp. FBKL.4005]|nr:hypothetical protein CFC35_41695 [Streptomyces sp. FBKL.4005]
MQISMTRAAHSRPLSEAEGDLLFSADHATTSPAAAQRRAETMIPIREVEDTFDIPDVQITGTVYKMNVQTDRKGAVLVAYTRDPETGRIGRSFIRFDAAGINYIQRRLSTFAV